MQTCCRWPWNVARMKSSSSGFGAPTISVWPHGCKRTASPNHTSNRLFPTLSASAARRADTISVSCLITSKGPPARSSPSQLPGRTRKTVRVRELDSGPKKKPAPRWLAEQPHYRARCRSTARPIARPSKQSLRRAERILSPCFGPAGVGMMSGSLFGTNPFGFVSPVGALIVAVLALLSKGPRPPIAANHPARRNPGPKSPRKTPCSVRRGWKQFLRRPESVVEKLLKSLPACGGRALPRVWSISRNLRCASHFRRSRSEQVSACGAVAGCQRRSAPRHPNQARAPKEGPSADCLLHPATGPRSLQQPDVNDPPLPCLETGLGVDAHGRHVVRIHG